MSRRKLSKITLILLVSAVFIGIAATPSGSKQNVPPSYTVKSSAFAIPNGPLIFMNDSDLTKYGFSGNGSVDNPYLFDFHNTTLEYAFNSTTTGIHIENITKHIIIRNVTISNNNSEVLGTGIRILADNIVIENVTIQNTLNGILMEGENLHINETTLNSDNFGIWSKGCNNFNITSTTITGASYGAYFLNCNNTLINDNIIQNGVNGIQMYGCINFRIENNWLIQNAGKGLFIIEISPKSGSLNYITRNRFILNEEQALIMSDDLNVQFYDESTKEGNYWSDWRGWGKHKVQKDIFDLYPMKIINTEGDLELASQFPFKFWFWIFAPTLVVLGGFVYFVYWKLIIQPTKQ
ncbi:MAG: hypothetical protein EU530_09420 [Promethearchaeota archaeon]|nr:MAG: hypothetical protein EU530_09420 [Candidatus Lokiarchaeota archaeon]